VRVRWSRLVGRMTASRIAAVVRPDVQRPHQLRHHRPAGDAATLKLKPIAGKQLVL